MVNRKRKKIVLCVSMTIVLLSMVVGCQQVERVTGGIQDSNISQNSVNLMDDIEKNSIISTSNEMEPADEKVAVLDFAMELTESSYDGENVLLSPISILYALGMTANGAGGDTLEQMEDVLGMDVESLNTYLYEYRTYVDKCTEQTEIDVHLANAIWFTDDEKMTVSKEFLQMNSDYYDASIYEAPFDETTLSDINAWTYQKTNGMIENILNEIPENAVMYLVNALAFEAEWENVYKESEVRDGIFTKEDGDFAFVGLLPNEVISMVEYMETLNGESLNDILEMQVYESVEVSIPKFEAEYETELSEVMMLLGMTDCFDSNVADFQQLGTYEGSNISISRILHKTYIAVDEQGTTAGAATVVEMIEESAMEMENVVRLNRPFVYMIIDTETNMPLFVGIMTSI